MHFVKRTFLNCKHRTHSLKYKRRTSKNSLPRRMCAPIVDGNHDEVSCMRTMRGVCNAQGLLKTKTPRFIIFSPSSLARSLPIFLQQKTETTQQLRWHFALLTIFLLSSKNRPGPTFRKKQYFTHTSFVFLCAAIIALEKKKETVAENAWRTILHQSESVTCHV